MFQDLPVDIDQDEALRFHLIRAQHHLYQASQVVYTTKGPIRGLLYRLRLLRAHNIAMTLYKQEIKREPKNLPQPTIPDPGKPQS